MDLTVFYAWQSDLPEKWNHYLIRDAAKDAVEALAKGLLLEESPRLDHDTVGETGTPEIAGTIFRKIRECGIVHR